jgi:hypothetical protein
VDKLTFFMTQRVKDQKYGTSQILWTGWIEKKLEFDVNSSSEQMSDSENIIWIYTSYHPEWRFELNTEPVLYGLNANDVLLGD